MLILQKKDSMATLGFPGGSLVKGQPPAQGTWVPSLLPEDPLEKEMAAHSSILARSIPGTEEPGGLQSMGSQRVGQALLTVHAHTHTHPHASYSNIKQGKL